MLIKFNQLYIEHGIRPTGVFHIGACRGEEIDQYKADGITRVVWIEALPTTFSDLQANIANHPEVDSLPINACVSDVDGEIVDFNISSNQAESSSMLEFGTHAQAHPDVTWVGKTKLKTIKADTLIAHYGIDVSQYDFLNIDLQGSELKALKGMEANMHKFNFAYIEVNREELYKGCAMEHEIDEFLAKHGFRPVTELITDNGWGDKFYAR